MTEQIPRRQFPSRWFPLENFLHDYPGLDFKSCTVAGNTELTIQSNSLPNLTKCFLPDKSSMISSCSDSSLSTVVKSYSISGSKKEGKKSDQF